ncbi:hypothetical protein [Catellatospora tritici]|uniref:hypothetical protein n=1 Tax=Catellatospora tritici TaxID=2851566 RepID=UPI001C2D75AD|nr:hypothetical protein [Catellatospora tritici]MBV1854832.1 hypothetical protein [Catellatospora tritici]
MPEQSSLEHSYRRLLQAYPRFYRRERGLELLTTLLDASRPGQLRASRDEAVHLLLSGLRYRLAPPGRVAKAVVGVAALWAAVVLSGVGAYLAWGAPSTERPELTETRIAALGDALAGQHASWVDVTAPDRLDMAYSYLSHGDFQNFAAEGWSGARPAPAAHVRGYRYPSTAQAAFHAAYLRLRAEGWQTGSVSALDSYTRPVFWASRDGLLLRVEATAPSEYQASLLLRFYQVEPSGVPVAALAGFLLGLAVSWPVLTWLAHRFVRTPRADRILALCLAVPALYACAANTADSLLSMVPDPESGGVLLAADFMYPLANQVQNPLAAIVIAVGLATTLGVIVCTPFRRVFAGPAPSLDTVAER